MRKPILFLCVFLLFGAFASGWLWLRADLPAPDAPMAPATETEALINPPPPMPAQDAETAMPQSPGSTTHARFEQAATAPQQAVSAESVGPSPRVDSLHGAESPEDSDWLAANGFPDSAEFEVLMGLPIAELEALAGSGDIQAANILDYRRLRRDPASQDAVRSLFDRAVSGELFPLQLLAWHYLQQPDRESQVVASAYHRVLALRGYYNGLYANTLISSGFTDGERLASEVYSLVIYNDLMRARIERFGTPFPVNPRPGMDQLFAGAQAMIHETEPSTSP